MPNNSQIKTEIFRRKAILLLIVTCFCLAGIHLLMVFTILPKRFAEGPFYAVHAFFIPLTLYSFDRIARKYVADHKSAVGGIITWLFLKMVAVALFLLPWVLLKSTYLDELVYQFLVLMFVLLIIEKILIAKLIAVPFQKN